MAAPRPALGHYRGGSLTHPMLVTCVLHIRSEGHREPRNEVGSLSPAERLVGFEPGTIRFWWQRLNPLGHYYYYSITHYYSVTHYYSINKKRSIKNIYYLQEKHYITKNDKTAVHFTNYGYRYVRLFKKDNCSLINKKAGIQWLHQQ